jgi:hypothetical protein
MPRHARLHRNKDRGGEGARLSVRMVRLRHGRATNLALRKSWHLQSVVRAFMGMFQVRKQELF